MRISNGCLEKDAALHCNNVHFQGFIDIHVRGRSSRAFPKKQYRVVLRDVTANLLGMPDDDDWILSGPYLDRSLIRNALAFELAKASNHWAPQYRFVELYFVEKLEAEPAFAADQYRGVYLLMESIKISDHRLAIHTMDSNASDVSGGYILEFSNRLAERYWSEWQVGWIAFWQPSPADLVCQMGPTEVHMKYPDPEQAPAAAVPYIKQFLSSLDAGLTLYGNAPDNVTKMLDEDALIDFMLHNELTKDFDAYISSVYFHKDRGGRLVAGPVWDKDLAFGNDVAVSNTSGWLFRDPLVQSKGQVATWTKLLLADSGLAKAARSRWWALRSSAWSDEQLNAAISRLQSMIIPEAACRNCRRWPLQQVISPSRQIQLTPSLPSWGEEVEAVRQWLLHRTAWMDSSTDTL